MNIHKLSVVLLALSLAAIAMGPCVSAADPMENFQMSIQPIDDDLRNHHVMPDYYRDAKILEPLSESEMLTVVVSQKTLGISSSDKKPELVSVPPSMLDVESSDTEILDNPDIRYEKSLDPVSGVVLIRMPKTLYHAFVVSSEEKNVELPTGSFCRFYDSLEDMNNHMQTKKGRLEFTTDDKRHIAASHVQTLPQVKETSAISKSSLKTLTDNWFVERVNFKRINTGTSYDYCIGQIQPELAYFSGQQDQFYIPQEREYVLNNQDTIEIVVNYDHLVYPSGAVVLFPQIYDNGVMKNLSTYENQGAGIIPLDPSTFPHAYGYHVLLANSRFYIGFIDMDTTSWYPTYVYYDADNPSTSFTNLYGSSEYNQMTQPVHDQFVAWTNPVIDEWARELVTGTWRYPNQVWQADVPAQDPDVDYVHIGTEWENNNLITYSYADYRWG